MKHYHSRISLFALLSAFFFGGCYTELQVMDRTDRTDRGPVTSTPSQRPAYKEPSSTVQPSVTEGEYSDLNEGSTYLEGYEDGVEDGWADAESYFFKDYESEQWYRDREINIWGPTYIQAGVPSWGSPSWGWRSTMSFYDPFWDPYWNSGFSFSFGWNSWNNWNRWGYWDPWSSWNSWSFGYPYGYTTYPSYGYGWGWNNYWIQNNYYFPYTSSYYKERALRDYGPRTTGLSSASRSGERAPSGRNAAIQGKQTDLGVRTLRSSGTSGSLERNREAIRTAVSRSATSRSGSSSGSSVIRSGATSRSGSSAVRSGSGTSRNPSPAVRSGGSSNTSGSGSGVTRGSTGGTRSSGSSGNVSSGQSRTKSEGSSVRSSGSSGKTSGSSSSGSVSRSSGSSKPAESSSTPKSSSRNSNSRKGGN